MSFSLPFERLKRIKNKYKLLVFGYIRNICPSTDIAPESVNLIILLFYYDFINSSVLSDDECDNLVSLFNDNNKFKDLENYSYKLIYRQTTDRNSFREKVHNKQNVLCLISTMNGNVFGGYTAKGWTEGGDESINEIHDNKAFIFSIRSSKKYPPRIFNPISKDEVTLRCEKGYICMFGHHCSIWMQDSYLTISKERSGGCYNAIAFEKPPHKDYLTGNDSGFSNSFKAIEIEVFQLTNSDNE